MQRAHVGVYRIIGLVGQVENPWQPGPELDFSESGLGDSLRSGARSFEEHSASKED